LKNLANHPTCPVYKMKNYSFEMGFDVITKTWLWLIGRLHVISIKIEISVIVNPND
jgi:hypothetical protein